MDDETNRTLTTRTLIAAAQSQGLCRILHSMHGIELQHIHA